MSEVPSIFNAKISAWEIVDEQRRNTSMAMDLGLPPQTVHVGLPDAVHRTKELVAELAYMVDIALRIGEAASGMEYDELKKLVREVTDKIAFHIE